MAKLQNKLVFMKDLDLLSILEKSLAKSFTRSHQNWLMVKNSIAAILEEITNQIEQYMLGGLVAQVLNLRLSSIETNKFGDQKNTKSKVDK